jgi:hypothetical protein
MKKKTKRAPLSYQQIADEYRSAMDEIARRKRPLEEDAVVEEAVEEKEVVEVTV